MDLARVAAITSVILLHSTALPPAVNVTQDYVLQWWVWDVWGSVAWFGVPLFVMISGALLLRPEKVDEPLGVFFRKRWKRIGLPFIFWGAVYLVWSVFVKGDVVTAEGAANKVLAGPYFHFWFLYMLVGLYLATPILRVLVTHMKRSTFKYFIILLLLGTFLQPVWGTLYNLNLGYEISLTYLFTFAGYVAAFLLGAYLRDAKVRRAISYGLLLAGIASWIVGLYFVSWLYGERHNYFLLGNLTVPVLAIAASLFLILTRVSYTNRLFRLISENTLSIYLFHVIVLETLENGYLGFTLNPTTMPIAVEFPLLTLITLIVTLAAVVALKKVPIIKNLI